jgi:hypothetical protein
VRVPAEAGNGKAKVTVTFGDWKEATVAPVTFEVNVGDAPVAPNNADKAAKSK